jgi:ATP/ADP translocase
LPAPDPAGATSTQPDSLGCFVRVAAHWAYTLFFILGELYGSIVISLLFW